MGRAGDYVSTRVRSRSESANPSSGAASGSEEEQRNASAIDNDGTDVEKTTEGDSVDATEETVVTS